MAETQKPLAGKLALVTGGSRGIGAAIATRLAADGATVIINYALSEGAAKKVVEAIHAAGGQAEAVHADLSTPEGPRNLFAGLDGAFGKKYAGKLDILVNNAGVYDLAPLSDATDESFDRVFMVNVRAVFQLSREASRRMGSGGRIINIGSGLGEAVPMPGSGIYSASKFAIAGFTRAWSRDLGPKGITVNAVQPGPVDTEMNPADSEYSDMQKKMTSVGRFGQPEEIAAAVAYLASPSAAFVNGERLTVDGGWNA